MTDKYAELRKAAQRRNIFCQPDVISEYRAAAHHETILALLAERDAMAALLDGVPQDAIDGGWTAKGLSAYAKSVETERNSLRNALILVLPLAKGYAAANRVGANDKIIESARAALGEKP